MTITRPPWEDVDVSCPAGHEWCEPAEDPRHFGEAGNIYTPSDDFSVRFDGLDRLGDLAAGMTAIAEELDRLVEAGWELAHPIEGGVMALRWTKDTAPPPHHSEVIDGLRAHERIERMIDPSR